VVVVAIRISLKLWINCIIAKGYAPAMKKAEFSLY